MELTISFPQQPTIYYDNVGTTYLCVNPVFHSRMKHVEIDFHFVHDQVSNGNLSVSHVSSQDQLVNALTKPLSHQRLLLLRPGLVSSQDAHSCKGMIEIILVIATTTFLEDIIPMHPIREIPKKILVQ